MTDRWDVIVIGAGASGSALAARLSEDRSRRVLVLEAGPVPSSLDAFGSALLDAARVPGADPRTPELWRYPARLRPGRDYTVFRGRVLGGSTTVNGGYFIRPRSEDFERWSSTAGPRWRYENALAAMRRMERDLDFGAGPLHGDSGPVPVTRADVDDPATAAFRAAARSRGHAEEPDKNAQGPGGVGSVPMNVADGIRWNAGAAYLLPVLGRPNLEVRGGHPVTRVVLEGGRAVAVEARHSGRTERFEAGEIVLCAGAFGSAQLLMLSGIGPADDLRRAGIDPVLDAPVGAGFSDHPQVVVEWRPRIPLTAPSRWISGALHLRTEGGPASGGAEILQARTSLAALTGSGGYDAASPLPLFVSLHDARSRGTMRLDPRDPAGPPLIDYRYLESGADRSVLRDAVRETVALLGTDAFAEIGSGPVESRLADADDDAIEEWISARLGTAIHACGTAPMGRAGDGFSVVDGAGLVHGVRALRVADTSILPSAPLRGPAVAAVLIGELIADAMR